MSTPTDILGDFDWSDDGASDAAIQAAQADLAATLPDDYVAVLQTHNGGEGWVGQGALLQLWSVEEVVDANRTLEVSTFAPGTVLIGSNGGGEFYGIHFEDGGTRYCKMPAVGMSPREAIDLGRSWQEFLRALGEAR